MVRDHLVRITISPWSLMTLIVRQELRLCLSGIEAFRCRTFVSTGVDRTRRFALLVSYRDVIGPHSLFRLLHQRDQFVPIMFKLLLADAGDAAQLFKRCRTGSRDALYRSVVQHDIGRHAALP